MAASRGAKGFCTETAVAVADDIVTLDIVSVVALIAPVVASAVVLTALGAGVAPATVASPPVSPDSFFRPRRMFHDISGSYTKASNIAITLSLLSRSTRMVFSQVERKVPSMPLASMLFVSIRVKRKGTFSGNLDLLRATSKQSPKSV